MADKTGKSTIARLKRWLAIIVFGTTTRLGRAFDIALLWAIVLSIVILILESVPWMKEQYGQYFKVAEWIIIILFTLEYIIRIWVVKKKSGYIFSFFGMIDFLSVASFYLSLIFPGSRPLLMLRAIRLLRIFRVYQLTHYLSESAILGKAMIRSLKRITVFLSVLLVLVIILGTVMYVAEGGQNGFETIPLSIYWAIVTITTVGYGDITPVTTAGKIIASIIMMLGYAIIAVPTGIITAELTKEKNEESKFHHQKRVGECPSCGLDIYDPNANYCRNCGKPLPVDKSEIAGRSGTDI